MVSKNTMFFAIMIIMVIIPVIAQEDFTINLNVGNLGYGINVPMNDGYSTETIITLLNIGIEHTKTNIGMEFTPFKGFNWRDTPKDSDDITGISLANLDLYWNVINMEFFYLGPFASINYMFVGKKIDWNRYVLTGGLHVGLRANIGRYNYHLFSVELGYRNIDGRSKYFIGAKIDVPVLIISAILVAVAGSSSSEDKNKHKNKRSYQ
jgi:hypothetical protein